MLCFVKKYYEEIVESIKKHPKIYNLMMNKACYRFCHVGKIKIHSIYEIIHMEQKCEFINPDKFLDSDGILVLKKVDSV